MSRPEAAVPVWEDVRVAAGLAAQHALRRRREQEGDPTIGWKLAFGASAAQRQYGISAPLAGFLSAASRIEPGGSCPIGTWKHPAIEPEIAVHLREDVPAGAAPDAVADAIDVVEPAIEIVDVDGQLDDLEAVLAGNVFQRAVVLGAPRKSWSALREEELRAAVLCDGVRAAACDDVRGALGRTVAELIGHLADLLAATGAGLRAGHVVITGALVPPIPVRAGQRISFELTPLGSTAVLLGA